MTDASHTAASDLATTLTESGVIQKWRNTLRRLASPLDLTTPVGLTVFRAGVTRCTSDVAVTLLRAVALGLGVPAPVTTSRRGVQRAIADHWIAENTPGALALATERERAAITNREYRGQADIVAKIAASLSEGTIPDGERYTAVARLAIAAGMLVAWTPDDRQ